MARLKKKIQILQPLKEPEDYGQDRRHRKILRKF